MRGLGRLRRAESLLRGAFERSGNGRHLAQLSEVLRMQGRPEEALGAAAEAAELRPDLETVWLQLVLAARDCGRGRTAFEAARRHARTFPDAEELWPLALEALVPDGDPGLAWAAAESSLAGGRRNAPLMINAGTAAWMAARPDLARSRWREAAALDPSDPLALHNLGMLALEEGDTSSARGYLQEALDVDPTFEASRRALDGL
jgi:tetratricopeptide (TPR) repeat protein